MTGIFMINKDSGFSTPRLLDHASIFAASQISPKYVLDRKRGGPDPAFNCSKRGKCSVAARARVAMVKNVFFSGKNPFKPLSPL